MLVSKRPQPLNVGEIALSRQSMTAEVLRDIEKVIGDFVAERVEVIDLEDLDQNPRVFVLLQLRNLTPPAFASAARPDK